NVALSASDPGASASPPTGSGIDKTYYKLDGCASDLYTGAIAVAGNGRHALEYWSTDVAGNVEAHQAVTVLVDSVNPTTSDNYDGLWHSGPVNVALSASDPGASASPPTGSGIDKTYYKLDGGAATLYTGAIAVAGNGRHALEYWSTDVAGNVEAHQAVTVLVDTVNPTTSDNYDGLWHSGPVNVALSASDPGASASPPTGSGIDKTYYKLDGGAATLYTGAIAVAGNGRHALEYWSTDVAGNVEAHQAVTVLVDTVNPTTSDNYDGLWHSGPVNVALSASDPGASASPPTGSGIDHTAWTRDPGTGAEASGTGTSVLVAAPSDHSNDGMHTIRYYSVDVAGNAEAAHVATVKIDTTPIPSQAGANAFNNTGTIAVGYDVSTAAAADLSGLDRLELWAKGPSDPAYGEVGAKTTAASEGTNGISCTVSDKAGNGNSANDTVKIDTVKPAISVSHPGANGAGWNGNSPVTVNVSASDATSDLSGAPSCTDGASPLTLTAGASAGTWTASVASEGTHGGHCSVSDKAGNRHSADDTVNIDTVKPAISVSHPGANGAGWNTNSPVTVTVAASDATSGLGGAPSCDDGGNSVTLTASGGGTWTASVASEGTHGVHCSVSDKAGNGNSADDTVKIDTVKPAISFVNAKNMDGTAYT